MNPFKYAIITPAHNEAERLEKVIDGIVRQKIKPVKWIIVDDRSEDETWAIITKFADTFDFIHPIKLSGNTNRMVGANVVHVFNQGLANLTEPVDYIVKMDADVVLTPNYFSTLQEMFEETPSLGMASGKTYVESNGSWVLERIPDMHVSGACKTYRMACFKEMNGLIPLLGWDILDNAKARMLGWETRSYNNLPMYHLRLMGSAKGMFRARIRTGLVMYTIRSHFLFVIGKSIFRSFEKPYFTGLFIPLGYLLSFLKRPERLQDTELSNFLRREQLDRLFGKTIKQEAFIPKKLTKDC